MAYIQKSDKGKDCVFCWAQSCEDGLENLVVNRGRYTYVILNRYPYTSGHLMVVPFEHVSELDALCSEASTEMTLLITRCVKILRAEYNAQGFNVGANIGSAAGAGIPKHFHFHIVPRWQGDTNFLSAIGETRLVPEALEDTYRRVKERWVRTYPERNEE
jgi:ATP adenylyltransferase